MPVSGGEAHLLARPVSGRCKSCKQGRLEAEKIEEKRIWFGWILEGNRPRPEPFCPACFAHRRCPASYSWSGNLQTFFLKGNCHHGKGKKTTNLKFQTTCLALASALELLLGPNTELVIAAFSPSNLLQVPNSRRMTDVEFCGNFSCSWERISSGSRLFFVTFPWPATVLLIFKALISFAKLEPPLYRMFVSSSWAKCIIDVVSCLCSYRTHFETKYKN
ncbi:uncharacterized protein LOC129639166 isoform X2 [Bubalus kerabau]|uniref:uncharacterized protein LOC129639166 isoform X2 n=1 Tax=Bubalus carabanensis TaxID=3119969 RepID=UPI00244ED765|nr:uncharacterized protein LOC129639166 isoform X2 [Bubalus carabanensis]